MTSSPPLHCAVSRRPRAALAISAVALPLLLVTRQPAALAAAADLPDAEVPAAVDGGLSTSADAGAPDAESAPATAAPTAAPPVEATLGDWKAKARPGQVKPGAIYEVSLEGDGIKEIWARTKSLKIPFFRSANGRWFGYGAVPVETAAGPLEVRFEAVAEDGQHKTGTLSLQVLQTKVEEHTLTVSKKFTSPSGESVRRMKADNQAFSKVYAYAFGPPLFSANFIDPRAGAERNARYGEKRIFNGKLQSRHLGLDLDGNIGDPVYAANDGEVRMVRDCFASGNTVMLAHGAGIYTGYFHLSQFKVKEGQKVKRGELIGLLGVTGRVTGPHLHLAAKIDGVQMDPDSLLGFDFFP